MKKIILFFLFPLTFYAQNDSIIKVKPKFSVIGLDKMNVVYRGIPNPLSIAATDAKSYNITGNGVIFQDGKYILKPGPGVETKVYVEIEKSDGSRFVEEHVFRVKGLPKGIGCIDGYYCIGNCLLEFNLKEIEGKLISSKIPDFVFPIAMPEVKSFTILSLKNKKLHIEGNILNKESIEFIRKNIDSKGEIYLIDIKPDFNTDLCFPPKYLIKLKIVK